MQYAAGWMFIFSSNFRNSIMSKLSHHTLAWNQSRHTSPEIHWVQVLELAHTPILFYKSAPSPIILKTSLDYTIVNQLIFDKLF